MKERPILFSASMVRAILDGKKTQTRRVVKSSRANNAELWRRFGDEPLLWESLVKGENGAYEHDWFTKCPYGTVGDQLWLRESWRIGAWNKDESKLCIDYCDGPRLEWIKIKEGFVKYWEQSTHDAHKSEHKETGNGFKWKPGESPCRWRPSIHMPRWASRINLLIKSIRVERLNEISEDDAKAEGVEPFFSTHQSIGRDQTMTTGERISDCEHRASFACLWDDIHGDNSWQQNPWVWVVEFEVMK